MVELPLKAVKFLGCWVGTKKKSSTRVNDSANNLIPAGQWVGGSVGGWAGRSVGRSVSRLANRSIGESFSQAAV